MCAAAIWSASPCFSLAYCKRLLDLHSALFSIKAAEIACSPQFRRRSRSGQAFLVRREKRDANVRGPALARSIQNLKKVAVVVGP